MGKIIYNGNSYDSEEEVHFAYWCEELSTSGLLQWWRNKKSFVLVDKVVNEYSEQIKTKVGIKTVQKTKTILQSWEYTPDFKLKWNKKCQLLHTSLGEKMTGLFVSDRNFSFIEIKPSFDKYNMERLFKNAQKVFFAKYGVFVNLIKLNDLFASTFVPVKLLKTKTGKNRKFKFEPITLKQFLIKLDARK